MSINVDKIKAQFPILAQTVYNKPLVYLDNAATTQKPQQVIDKIVEVYSQYNSNVHRGVHYMSNKATTEAEYARKIVQHFINAPAENQIIFTSGATQSINLVASSFCYKFVKPGDEIIVSEMEHHSNIVPWQINTKKCGAKIVKWGFNNNGGLCINELKKIITKNTKLIAVAHVSNTLGTINPVKQIVEIAHSHNIPVLVDGAQAVQHLKVDVQDIDCDFYVFSGHKIYGPNGTGVLYGKEKWLELIPPYQGGGEMIESVSFDNTVFNKLPFKFEAGTPDYVGVIALAEAVKYVENIGIENIADYENELFLYAINKLSQINDIIFYGTDKNRASVISFNIKGQHPYDVGSILDKLGIAVRTGTHCAEPVMQHFNITGTVRASLAFYNTFADIDALYNGIIKAKNLLQ